MRNGPPQAQQPHPPWVNGSVGRACHIWLAHQKPFEDPPAVEAVVASIGGGFVELVIRERQPAPVDNPLAATWKYRGTYLVLGSICRIEPVEAQWAPPRLAVVEKQKLVVP